MSDGGMLSELHLLVQYVARMAGMSQMFGKYTADKGWHVKYFLFIAFHWPPMNVCGLFSRIGLRVCVGLGKI